MITTINYKGEQRVAVILSNTWGTMDADSYSKALVEVFEACFSHDVSKDEVRAESFFWLNLLIKDFSEKGGEV